MDPIITPADLRPLLAAAAVVLLDARTGPDVRPHYLERHLAGAHYLALEHDLAQPTTDPAQGGRHPLPPAAHFARLVGQLGIGPDTHVVVYDAHSAANAAARCWWMLRALGYPKVQVLDGGLAAALAAGLPTAAGPETPAPLAAAETSAWHLPTASQADVQHTLQRGGLVIDVRDARRYRGETEPIDLVAGHIPGAVNVEFAGNLDAQGHFLPPQQLRHKYLAVLAGRHPADVIVHCGSGVTACHTLLALAHAGLELPRLYVGSWSEWSRSGNPIATG